MLKLLAKLLMPGPGPLFARLDGVNGFTGRGVIGYAAGADGARSMRIILKGVAGRKVEMFADGALAATAKVENGRVWAFHATERGDDLPALCDGAMLEIRQNGDVILSGVLSRK